MNKIPGQKRTALVEPIAELNRIKVRDNGEPLVDVLEVCYGIEPADADEYSEKLGHLRYHARERVAEMLQLAQNSLPKGYVLQIHNIYRSLDEQWEMYKRRYNELKAEHPKWPENILRRETNRWVHPPDVKTPPGHSTGGCVDLFLRGPDGEPLDMISPYTWDNADREKRGPALYTFSKLIDERARQNRAMLIKAMSCAGFTNYVGEYWHWSYGDSCWAWRQRRKVAIYGAAEPPDNH